MANRVTQPASAKLGGSGKSNYDLFQDYEGAKSDAAKKYEEPEQMGDNSENVSSSGSDIMSEFASKYGKNLVGTKLANAINEFGREKGIEGSGKESFAKMYINDIRKPSLTTEQVKSQYREDLKGSKLAAADYSPFLREGYKQLESYGIKVADAAKQEEPKKSTQPVKKGSEELLPLSEKDAAFQKKWEGKGVKFNAAGEAINPPKEMIDEYNGMKDVKAPEAKKSDSDVLKDLNIGFNMDSVGGFNLPNMTQEQKIELQKKVSEIEKNKLLSAKQKQQLFSDIMGDIALPNPVNPLPLGNTFVNYLKGKYKNI